MNAPRTDHMHCCWPGEQLRFVIGNQGFGESIAVFTHLEGERKFLLSLSFFPERKEGRNRKEDLF